MSKPTITNRETGKSLDLVHVQDDKVTTQGQVEGMSVYYDDSDENYLYSLAMDEEISMTGIASGMYLSNQSGYSSDPSTALFEWFQKLLSLVNGNQGIGWDLDSTERDRTNIGVIESAGWQVNEAEPYLGQWDITFKRGEGVEGAEDTSPGSVSVSEDWTLDGNDLGHLVSLREEKLQKWNQYEMALSESASENIQTTKTGAKRRITISGRIVGETQKNQFDNAMRDLISKDQVFTYDSGVPGHTLTVMPREFDSTRQAGWTRLGEYGLVLEEGQQNR